MWRCDYPLTSLSRELWWDAATPPRDNDPDEFKRTLQRLVHESYEHLSRALDLPGMGLAEALDEEYFARTIGMFEQNNVGVRCVYIDKR